MAGARRREQDKRVLSDSHERRCLEIRKQTFSIFGKEVMGGQYSYFPLFLTSPLLLSQSQ